MVQDPGIILIYGNPFCMMVGPVRAILERSDIPYEYIDIVRDQQATEKVKQINNGFASVPTLVFPDDSTMTEPTIGELRMRLNNLGYQVHELTILDRVNLVINNPYTYLFGALLVLFGFAGDNTPFILLGTFILALALLLGLVRRRG